MECELKLLYKGGKTKIRCQHDDRLFQQKYSDVQKENDIELRHVKDGRKITVLPSPIDMHLLHKAWFHPCVHPCGRVNMDVVCPTNPEKHPSRNPHRG